MSTRFKRCSPVSPDTSTSVTAPPYYYAEDYHQEYLAKNPDGYCGLGGTGVSCPIGLGSRSA
jgi:peptide-methionine (S)-S-oxide reductase